MDASRVRSSALISPHALRASATQSSTSEITPQFLKTAAQELNNPITTIKTALTLLNSSNLKPQQRQRYLDMIGQACDRQSTLINHAFDLLELQLTTEKNTLEQVQLWDLVPGVVSTYQPLAQENNILLAYTVAKDLPPVFAIESYLKQVLVGLLANSIQFVKSDGRIWVKAHPHGEDKVALVIQDDGRGIEPSALSQVFNPFYRHMSDGNGLGLTLVQQWLAHCGASISVSSTPGEGTAFTILLSAASA
ncbi:sensor histidine kinase [Leptothoe kymatousa]|uniref:histidine kinase n=1 Tax=Leptothoe kymatousa TAU-MAC 1615 TaxID=2364775 RepID=A0ABS5Y7B1_9CYAN|nr:HAMP domain-containing sensor histidine kinase [Leptothoe kymatousa]MBT9313717.1 HAMP domain-containing histidine kinase [Leptothoe kymatousa TAU-MAC 1615]